jgi:hypothetical protein
VPLETLRTELDAHLATLKNEARAAAWRAGSWQRVCVRVRVFTPRSTPARA